jgi:hypothetical protein
MSADKVCKILLGVLLSVSVQAQPDGEVSLEVVSGRADSIAAGAALVRVHLPELLDVESLQLERLDQYGVVHAVSNRFGPETGRTTLLGLLTGLEPGTHVLRARRASDGQILTELELSAYPAHGPVFSGPQQQPFFCNPGDSGLGLIYDEFCHTASVVEYFYRSSSGGFQALPDPTLIPVDVAMTTTTAGLEVPFIVRNERGTINRGIYSIAVLHDPQQPDWGNPLLPQSQWNGRLYYQLEGACRPGFSQDRERAQDILGALQPSILGAGYAIARHSFTRHGNACGNDVLSAESMMMVKEHFSVNYGAPLSMIGAGGSGGAIIQYLTAQNYPGILDGLITGFSFPDAFSIASGSADAALLNRTFIESPLWDYDAATAARFPDDWDETLEQRVKPLTAVSGFGSWALNMTWVTGNARNLEPGIYVGRYVPEEQLYHPQRRPDGIRATIYEAGRNTFGTDPLTGFARRPLDNTGVQYGLVALHQGLITAEQFVSLNEQVGGFDIDGQHVPERMAIAAELAALTHRSGRVLHGSGGLAEVPILAVGLYQDTVPLGADYHDRFRDFSIRARLLNANGHFDNHVIWHSYQETLPFDFLDLPRLRVMDAWVTAIKADLRDIPLSVKVVANRPTDLNDRCHFPGGAYQGVQWPPDDLTNPCIAQMPPAGDPRIAAGGPLSNDVIKCQLTPLDRNSYVVSFTDEQWLRLQVVFADGVCDWSAPGVGQENLPVPWLRYDEPGQPRPMSGNP